MKSVSTTVRLARFGATATLLTLAAIVGCDRPSGSDSPAGGKASHAASTSRPEAIAASSAAHAHDSGLRDERASDRRAGESALFSPEAAERVMQKVNGLPLVGRACKKRRCSLTVDNDGR